MVRRAVDFYDQDLGREDKEKIEQCLESIKFDMGNQLFGLLDRFNI